MDPIYGWNVDELKWYVRLIKRLEILWRTDLWFLTGDGKISPAITPGSP